MSKNIPSLLGRQNISIFTKLFNFMTSSAITELLSLLALTMFWECITTDLLLDMLDDVTREPLSEISNDVNGLSLPPRYGLM